jgi:predicted 3-demethylubiquinone-9 3-methyltransferase (glyoxalase superfamily)
MPCVTPDPFEWVHNHLRSAHPRFLINPSKIEVNDMANDPIKLAPFLTFSGQAADAMEFYQSLFPDAQQIALTKTEGSVLNGQLMLKGQLIMFMDLAPEYSTPFSWAISLYVNCDDEAEFDQLFKGLSGGGLVMMGPEPVMSLRKVAWVTDRFGVTWQLVWE